MGGRAFICCPNSSWRLGDCRTSVLNLQAEAQMDSDRGKSSWGRPNPHSCRFSIPDTEFHVRKHCFILPSCKYLVPALHFVVIPLAQCKATLTNVSSVSLKLLPDSLSYSQSSRPLWANTFFLGFCTRKKSPSWWNAILLSSEDKNCSITTPCFPFFVLVVRKQRLWCINNFQFHYLLLLYGLFLFYEFTCECVFYCK